MIRKLISEKFDGDAIQKIRKKRKIILKGHYKYMAAFLADQVKGLATSTEKIINTPFGTVTVKKTGTISNPDCIIFKDRIPGDYKQLSSYLDAKCLDEMVLTTIYKYLSMPYISSVTSIEKFNSKVVIDAQRLNDYLAVFCGILMVAEPLRFGDGGGLSRSKIRKIFKFMKGGEIKNPYSVVFADASQIINLGTDKDTEGLAVFSHVDGATQKAVREGEAMFASPGSDKRKWRSKYPDPNFIPGGKKQQLNQIAGSPGYDESQASFDDNLKRTHHFDEDVSDDEDIKEEIDEAKCKLCHKFYKLGTNRDILLCGSCREKEEGGKFLSLIENNQLEAAEQYGFLVKQNLTLAEHYYLLISKNQFDIAEIFIKLFKSYKDHSYSMNYYYLSLKNNQKILEMYLKLVEKNLKLTHQYFYEIMENCDLNKAKQYFDIIMKTENVKLGNFFYNICKKCVMEKKLPEVAEQFYQLISEDKLSEAEVFYRQYFTD